MNNIYTTALIPTLNKSPSILLDITAVLDSRTSGKFVKINAKFSNVKTATNPIYVKELGSNMSQSTHT